MPALDPASYPAYAAECGDPSRTKVLGFGERPALLLVDVCEAYYDQSSPISVSEADLAGVTSSLTALIQAARQSSSRPIIFAQTTYTHPGLLDAGILGRKAPSHAALFQKDGPDNKLAFPAALASVAPLPTDLLHRKKYPSPFFGTNLAAQLTALGVDTLVIAGFATSGSVRATVLDAMQSGFRAMIVGAACGDGGGSEVHWANLMDVGAKYGDVVDLQAAIKSLSGA